MDMPHVVPELFVLGYTALPVGSIASKVTQVVARATAATCGAPLQVDDSGVLGRELVSPLAVSLGFELGSDRERTSQDILSPSANLQMVRITAAPNTAKVIESRAFGDRASGHLVEQAVGQPLLAIEVELPVALSEDGSFPEPASLSEVDAGVYGLG